MMRKTIITMIRMMTMARIAEDRWALTSCLIDDDDFDAAAEDEDAEDNGDR